MSRVRPTTLLKRAFTLVELLVVIGIIALLIAILLPSLAAARQSSQAVTCMSNMRQIGLAFMQFAMEHRDRLPGGGYLSPPRNTYVAWNNILNREVFNTPGLNPDHPIARAPGNGTLTCPNFQRSPNASYGYAYTIDATGGSWSKYWAGPYGLDVIPASQIDPAFSHYWLGAKLSQFRLPAQKFLLVEHEYTSEVVGVKGANPVNLSEGPLSFPPAPNWSNASGNLAFRHPLYRAANFLFVDGHVEKLEVTETNLNTHMHFGIKNQ